ncbi:MAG TPA: Pr6Pr family membrane protein [Acidimicrobiia bacterium]|nr:Pr6Pr family membrane protein [Acidimicrobiia bacterium]
MGRTVLALTRIAFGLLILVAMITMIRFLVDEGSFNALNFFTFFTILSNLLAMGVLLEGGRRMLTGTPPIPDMIRGAAVVYMTVTYIVFAVLLRGLEEELQTHLAWVDSVFHRVAPIVLMLGWVVDPPKERIPFRRALWWLAFPLIWVVFTMIRGAIDGRYPYPFLDPANGGYGIVFVYIVAITLLFVFVCWVVAAAGSILRSRRADA